MAAQDANTESYATPGELNRLAQRQEVLLSQLEQLQSRVDRLSNKSNETPNNKNQNNTNETKHHTTSHTHHRHKSRTGRISTKDFNKLQQSQNEMFDRLLNVAKTVEHLGNSQNVTLPDQSAVDEAMKPILQLLDSRLNKVIAKTKFLIEMAKQSGDPRPEMTPDSVRSQGTPVFSSRPRKLSSAGLEPMQTLPFHHEPKETESAEFWRRINELEYSVNHFKEMLIELKKEITPRDVYNVLSNMNLGLNLQQVMHARHISIVTKLMTNNETNVVDFDQLCQFALDINKTDRGDHKHEWHRFRRALIGMERKEGCMRICYRFDGWPYGQTVRLFHRLNTKSNQVMPNDIAHMIHNATKEHVEFEQISYAEKSKHGTGKTTWTKIDKNDAIPLHVERDGWLEVDVWLKTTEFIRHKRGRPLPKYA